MAVDPKHNSLGGAAAAQLSGYVSRIERLQGEIDALGDDKGEVYSEVRAAGFDKKTVGKMVLRRRLNRQDREEDDVLLDLYEAAIATLGGAVECDPLD